MSSISSLTCVGDKLEKWLGSPNGLYDEGSKTVLAGFRGCGNTIVF